MNAVPPVFPFKPGDWVVDAGEQIAQVRSVWADPYGLVADLWFYSHAGERVGRISPIMGGPRTFEPACPVDGWRRIAEPDFPVTLQWIQDENGKITAKYWAGERLPNRAWSKRVRKQPVIINLPPVRVNFDPELEAKAKLIAAQTLRDTARELLANQTRNESPQASFTVLIAKAEQLEQEARALREAL